jgi:hypothetical protein
MASRNERLEDRISSGYGADVAVNSTSGSQDWAGEHFTGGRLSQSSLPQRKATGLPEVRPPPSIRRG